MFSYPSSFPTRHKKYKERKYSPSDVATANNEGSRDAIEMATLPNAAALHQDKEAIVKPGPGATGITTRPVVDSFDLSEDQIKLSRGLFTFNRITGSFNRGKKK